MFSSIALPLALAVVARAQYTATYLPSNAPPQSEGGQTGTNQCGTGSNQTSECQNVYINSVTDFCLWAPPDTTYEGQPATIGETEEIEVAWCMKSGYGTRLIPNGAITGAHFVQTPDYVQVTGVGDLTQLNIPNGDEGGELDPHGATGSGNPVGGLVFGSSYGTLQQYHEWTNFMAYNEFCFRACVDGPMAPTYCEHVYDTLGCDWNMPGNYTEGIFENCLGDSTQPMGVYTSDGTTTTFSQGDPSTPAAHVASSSSSCTFLSTISNGVATGPTASVTSTSTSVTGSMSTSVTASTSRTSGSTTGTSTGAKTSGTSSRSTGSASGSAASASTTGGHSGATSLIAGHAGSWLVLAGVAAGVVFIL